MAMRQERQEEQTQGRGTRFMIRSQQKNSVPVMWIGIGAAICAILAILFLLKLGAVKVGGDVSAGLVGDLRARGLVRADEEVRAYCDGSFLRTGSKIAIITADRLIYCEGNKATALDLNDISDVRFEQAVISSDDLRVKGGSGKDFKDIEVEIPFGGGGPAFHNALDSAMKQARNRLFEKQEAQKANEAVLEDIKPRRIGEE